MIPLRRLIQFFIFLINEFMQTKSSLGQQNKKASLICTHRYLPNILDPSLHPGPAPESMGRYLMTYMTWLFYSETECECAVVVSLIIRRLVLFNIFWSASVKFLVSSVNRSAASHLSCSRINSIHRALLKNRSSSRGSVGLHAAEHANTT